jgi:signal transduction histidine kinase
MASPLLDSAPALFHPPARPDDFTLPRLRWLVRLRWLAIAGIALATLLVLAGFFPGVNWPVLLATAVASSAYNALLWNSHRQDTPPVGWRAAMFQALVDILALTVVLWAAGGIDTPFVAYYVFHVALVGILAGPRAAWFALGASGLGATLLACTDIFPQLAIGAWAPVQPWDLLAELAAFVTTAGGIGYIVMHTMNELRSREKALVRAREQVALEYQLLNTTLQQLEAGLEVVDDTGNVLWRNKRAEVLGPLAPKGASWVCPGSEHSCEKDVTGICPVKQALEHEQPGRCRFAAQIDGAERVYEMISFPLSFETRRRTRTPRVMNLYVDRTEATLDEQRLVTTERLVSLGRVAQGVAHELNTPLATIRTLSADMRAAINEFEKGEDGQSAAILEDLAESAALIQDETRRLGRITQALLAGGDLVRARVDGEVPVAAVVERARALVFAGVRDGPDVEVHRGVDDLDVAADQDRLVQVLVNLLQNAHDAVGGRSDAHVVVRARMSEGHVEITIDDDGPGLPPEVLGRLFEPFTTTKPPGEGTGLGLYTSYMLVQAMGGTLRLDNREEAGVRATVRLPAATGGGELAPVSSLTQRAS